MADANAITVGHTVKLNIVMFSGEPVLTFHMIDEVHVRNAGSSQNVFHKNKQRFVEGKHYYMISMKDAAALEAYGVNVPPRGLTLITKRGYLLLVKSFTDDLAWEVQEQLVDHYFEGQMQTLPLIERAKLNPQQRDKLLRRVDSVCMSFKMSNQAEAKLFNLLRYQFNVGNVDDILSEDYDKAMAIIEQAWQQSLEILDYRVELEKMILEEYFGKGIPFTATLRKKYKEKFQRRLGQNPNWQEAAAKLATVQQLAA